MPPGIDLFHPAEPDDEAPDLAADECGCQPADDQYLLTIEDGRAVLVHAACGKNPPSSWGDWHELVTMDQPIPVTVNWQTECTGSPGHSHDGCDCDYWVQVTATGVPEDVRAAALASSHKHAAAWHLAHKQPSAAMAALHTLAAAGHSSAAYNTYGSCAVAGFRSVEGTDRKARISHVIPEPDLLDPDRPSSDDLAAERHRQVDAYAATLTAAGWTVERRGPVDRRPWLLATPPAQAAS